MFFSYKWVRILPEKKLVQSSVTKWRQNVIYGGTFDEQSLLTCPHAGPQCTVGKNPQRCYPCQNSSHFSGKQRMFDTNTLLSESNKITNIRISE